MTNILSFCRAFSQKQRDIDAALLKERRLAELSRIVYRCVPYTLRQYRDILLKNGVHSRVYSSYGSTTISNGGIHLNRVIGDLFLHTKHHLRILQRIAMPHKDNWFTVDNVFSVCQIVIREMALEQISHQYITIREDKVYEGAYTKELEMGCLENISF